jgi:hypothetical protein
MRGVAEDQLDIYTSHMNISERKDMTKSVSRKETMSKKTYIRNINPNHQAHIETLLWYQHCYGIKKSYGQ